jgi:hypothetical protein
VTELVSNISELCSDGKVSIGVIFMAFEADGYSKKEIEDSIISLLQSGSWTIDQTDTDDFLRIK